MLRLMPAPVTDPDAVTARAKNAAAKRGLERAKQAVSGCPARKS
jgi:hypothetical protein